MLNVGPGELIAILALALIVLGPNRLPEAVRSAGRLMGELRRISSGFQEELRSALEDSDVERDLDRLRTGPERDDRPELGPVPDEPTAAADDPGDSEDREHAGVVEQPADHEDHDDHDDEVLDGSDQLGDGPEPPGDERAAS